MYRTAVLAANLNVIERNVRLGVVAMCRCGESMYSRSMLREEWEVIAAMMSMSRPWPRYPASGNSPIRWWWCWPPGRESWAGNRRQSCFNVLGARRSMKRWHTASLIATLLVWHTSALIRSRASSDMCMWPTLMTSSTRGCCGAAKSAPKRRVKAITAGLVKRKYSNLRASVVTCGRLTLTSSSYEA